MALGLFLVNVLLMYAIKDVYKGSYVYACIHMHLYDLIACNAQKIVSRLAFSHYVDLSRYIMNIYNWLIAT